jgi:hypothetical protein
MTKDEALKLALEALENLIIYDYSGQPDNGIDLAGAEAITAIKEALAQLAQEPVAWGVFEGNLHDIFFTQAEAQKMAELKGSHAEVRPLYTAPQPAQEPFGWYSAQEDEFMTDKIYKEHERLNSYTHIHGKFDLPLYTTPPLAQPAQEPVAWEQFHEHLAGPFYTTPQPVQKPDTNEETVTYVADVLAGKSRRKTHEHR